jgi:peroxiredoxin
MRKLFLSIMAAATLAAPALMAKEAEPTAAPTGAVVGQMAPALMAKDIKGQDVDLAALKGKLVVLEWTNHDCPFVKKHYDPKNMQAVQKHAADQGVVWISIVSSAPEKQGHVTAEKAGQIVTVQGATITHKILDESGAIGRAYGAKTTPHMFVIDKDGKIAYMGAIDSDSSFKPEAIAGATNYVRAAIDELVAGKPVTTAQTEPYGCSVKY